jgi:hypothetical protein
VVGGRVDEEPDRSGAGRRLGQLAVARTRGRPEVVDPVPDLDEDRLAGALEPKIRAAAGRARIVGCLEPGAPTRQRGKPNDQLLGLEMTGIVQWLRRVAREPDRDRPPKGDPDRDPGLDRRSLAVAALEVADL